MSPPACRGPPPPYAGRTPCRCTPCAPPFAGPAGRGVWGFRFSVLRGEERAGKCMLGRPGKRAAAVWGTHAGVAVVGGPGGQRGKHQDLQLLPHLRSQLRAHAHHRRVEGGRKGQEQGLVQQAVLRGAVRGGGGMLCSASGPPPHSPSCIGCRWSSSCGSNPKLLATSQRTHARKSATASPPQRAAAHLRQLVRVAHAADRLPRRHPGLWHRWQRRIQHRPVPVQCRLQGKGAGGWNWCHGGVWRRGGTALRQGHRVVCLGAGATGSGASWCSFASAHPCRALQFFEVLLRPLQLGQELAGAGQCQVGPAGKSKGETLRSFVRLPSNTANRVGRGNSDDAGWFCPPPCEHLCITTLETRAGTVATVCESEWEEEQLGRACPLTSRPWAPTGRSRLRKSTWLLLAAKW